MLPQVSIIIPIYNVEKFLSRCLESVVNQTLRNIEIICINDGSTDNSYEILKKFAAQDERMIVINQDNKGPGAARNVAMTMAKGEYIGFIDGDDWIELNYFEKLYDTAKKYDADMACCSIIRKYPSFKTRKKLDIKEEKLYHSAIEKYKITESPRKCYVYNKIYKRSKLDFHKIRFPEGVFFEDVAFSIRALYFLGTLVTVPKTTYYYWVNYKSTTRNMTNIKQEDLLAARQDFIEFSKKYHIICDEKWYIKKKITYKCFGIPLMKIKEWETIKRYYLFAFFPIFEKRISL
ncbi:MAG: glycosyltransferase [Holosporaceae bacterium]|jgi:glycosyltransferase involved in cell wall biosynthesis|nr:glycosyltransferase [Holosporaceae bacterium]